MRIKFIFQIILIWIFVFRANGVDIPSHHLVDITQKQKLVKKKLISYTGNAVSVQKLTVQNETSHRSIE